MKTFDPEKKNAVLMGRKTWESIPIRNRPLPGRLNVVLTRSGGSDMETTENVVICGSMPSALELLAGFPYSQSIEKIFVIGGGQIYSEALNAPACEAIHITEIETSIECDTFMPPIDSSVFRPWYSSFPMVENDIHYSFTTYVRVRSSAADHLNQNAHTKFTEPLFLTSRGGSPTCFTDSHTNIRSTERTRKLTKILEKDHSHLTPQGAAWQTVDKYNNFSSCRIYCVYL